VQVDASEVLLEPHYRAASSGCRPRSASRSENQGREDRSLAKIDPERFFWLNDPEKTGAGGSVSAASREKIEVRKDSPRSATKTGPCPRPAPAGSDSLLILNTVQLHRTGFGRSRLLASSWKGTGAILRNDPTAQPVPTTGSAAAHGEPEAFMDQQSSEQELPNIRDLSSSRPKLSRRHRYFRRPALE